MEKNRIERRIKRKLGTWGYFEYRRALRMLVEATYNLEEAKYNNEKARYNNEKARYELEKSKGIDVGPVPAKEFGPFQGFTAEQQEALNNKIFDLQAKALGMSREKFDKKFRKDIDAILKKDNPIYAPSKQPATLRKSATLNKTAADARTNSVENDFRKD